MCNLLEVSCSITLLADVITHDAAINVFEMCFQWQQALGLLAKRITNVLPCDPLIVISFQCCNQCLWVSGACDHRECVSTPGGGLDLPVGA